MTVFPQRPFLILYKKVQVKLADIEFSMSAKVGYVLSSPITLYGSYICIHKQIGHEYRFLFVFGLFNLDEVQLVQLFKYGRSVVRVFSHSSSTCWTSFSACIHVVFLKICRCIRGKITRGFVHQSNTSPTYRHMYKISFVKQLIDSWFGRVFWRRPKENLGRAKSYLQHRKCMLTWTVINLKQMY